MPANKNTPSMHYPWRRNVTTSIVGLKSCHIHKHLTQTGETQRHNLERSSRRRSSSSSRRTSTVHFDTGLIDLDLDSKSQEYEKA